MTEDEIKLLDTFAGNALVAMIAKADYISPTTHGENPDLQTLYTAMANGAYSYAEAMLKTRHRVLEYYEPKPCKPEPEPKEELLNLHGIPVYADTVLQTRWDICNDTQWRDILPNDIDQDIGVTPLQWMARDTRNVNFYRVKM